MKKLVYALMLAALLLAAIAGAALAQTEEPGEPVGPCPNGFHLHMVGDHHGDHEHNHVGLAGDANGDGWICVKHVTPSGDTHVHVDNYRPLAR